MTYFALLWKARTIEKYRSKYEKEKINSIMMANTEMPKKNLFQKWRVYRYDAKQRISTTFQKLYPKGSGMSNFFIYLRTDRTFPNFVLKSILGFVGGIILTYLCFMFFVFQLSISLIHATIMSSIIGVLLTLGLAFSYRIRCLVFLLIPQFFSRVGRYTLTCYALVLILTGPATNTLKNSEVLSESMACSQEQIKTSVHQIRNSMEKPLNSVKDSLKSIIERMNMVAMKVKKMLISLNRLAMSIVHVIQSSFSWLESTAKNCNKKLGTPYEHCTDVLKDGIANCKDTVGPKFPNLCSVAYVACGNVKPYKSFCAVFDYADGAFAATIKKKSKNFNDRVRAMLFVDVHIHHSYSFSSNASRSASQVAAGIVTEIRNRADPLLTWLSWSSCVTSLFLLLIIFRAKYYQHMYETRSRFDNRFVTKELRELDLNRQRQGRDTVLPLNRRERAKYITTTSFRLVSTEKVHLNRSAVFMVITTFKLLIHMIADYSLYWVLITIRYHGRFQSTLAGAQDAGVYITGSGFASRMLRSLIGSLNVPLISTTPYSLTCLPDPYPPDFRRYLQIGVLIILLWFFALFEPYGLRLRHMIMGHYRPERAKTRAVWLYNHILRTRGSFMKFARRKLHREYKCCSEAKFTFRRWLQKLIFCQWLQTLLGIKPEGPICLLCGTTEKIKDLDTQLIRCETPNCPGIFCSSCFTDIGKLCTICLSPGDYGDQSDRSLEKGSSDDNESDDDSSDSGTADKFNSRKNYNWRENNDSQKKETRKSKYHFFTIKTSNIQENIPLLKHTHCIPQNTYNYNAIQTKYKKLTSEPTQDKINLNPNDEAKAQVNLELTNKLEVKQISSDKKRRLLLSQHLIHQFKLFRTNFRRKSVACDDTKKASEYNQPKEEYISNNMCDSRRLRKFKLKLNVFNKSVIVNAYKLVSKTKHRKRSQKFIRRRKHFELRKNIMSNKSKMIKQIMRRVIENNYKTKTHGNKGNKESKPYNFDNKKGECSRQIKPTEIETIKPKANQNSNDKVKEEDKNKDIDNYTDRSYSCTEIFRILCSKYWRSFRLTVIPCTDSMSDERKSLALSKENKNYKLRKKTVSLTVPLVIETKNKKRKDVEDTRKYRIETFLDQQQWINCVYKQEIGYGDKKKDENTVNEELMKLKNKAQSIQIKEANIDGIHLKAYPIINIVGKNSNVRGCRASGYEATHIKEENNRSKSQSRTKEVLARFRKKCLKTKETSPSVPHLKTVVSAIETSDTQNLPSLGFRNDADNVPSSDKYYQRHYSDESVEVKTSIDNKYYRDDTTRVNNDSVNRDFYRDGWFCRQNTICGKDICSQFSKASKSPSSESSEDSSENKIHWTKLIRTVSGRFYNLGVGCHSMVLKELYTSLVGMTEDKGCSTKDNVEAPSLKDYINKCINTISSNLSRGSQYSQQDGGKREKNKGVQFNSETHENVNETCDANVNAVIDTCTCATQHFPLDKEVRWTPNIEKQHKVNEHHKHAKQVNHKRSRNANHKDYEQKFQRSSSAITLKDISSIKSDGTKTDTTVCSLATVDYRDEKKLKTNRFKVKVITKANQSTLTDKQTVCDVSTGTDDWWSPITERRGMISLEKKKGYTMHNQRKYERKHSRNIGISTEGRFVKFMSRAQIIPRGTIDILSPSRYLLESQKYYNELFSNKLYAPHVFPVTQMQRPQEIERNRSSTGGRRQTRRSSKTKRLEECYSPKRQESRKDKNCKVQKSQGKHKAAKM